MSTEGETPVNINDVDNGSSSSPLFATDNSTPQAASSSADDAASGPSPNLGLGIPPPPPGRPGGGNIAAILEAANDLRKMDDGIPLEGRNHHADDDAARAAPSSSAFFPGGDDFPPVRSSSASSPAPTIDEIADALSDEGDLPPVYDNYDTDDSLSDTGGAGVEVDGTSGSRGYTAETVAAISSLMKGEESPLLFASSAANGSSSASQMEGGDNNGDDGSYSSSSNGTGNGAAAKRDITLQDRATAMISVYKDYLQEEEGRLETKYGGSFGDDDADDADDDDDDEDDDDDDDIGSLERAALRREEIKVATLEKFCRNPPPPDGDSSSSDSDSSSDAGDTDGRLVDDEEGIDSDDDDIRLHGRRLHSLRPPPSSSSSRVKAKAAKKRPPPPTAATTTAAFRLKAEVALLARAAAGGARDAAGAARKAVGRAASAGAGAKKKKKEGQEEKEKDEEVRKRARGEVENDYDFRDYRREAEEEEGYRDERHDDMEHGVPASPSEESAVYGMHILDRDEAYLRRRSSSFRARSEAGDSDDEEAVGIFDDLCDELGVTPDTHPELLHFYERPRFTRYRYPVFRTKKFRRSVMYGGAFALLLLVIVSILSAASNGFEEARRKGAPPLPDWKADEGWRERQKLEWERDHVNDEDADGTEAGVDAEDADLLELFQSVAAAHRPVWYDRSTGWTGRTYSEALAWCDSRRHDVPCPYEVYCPDGENLIAGAMDDGDGESWAPVVDEEDEWVQVGGGGEDGRPCDLYSAKYGRRPGWGKDGEGAGNEELTRHVMCCRSNGAQQHGDATGGHVARPVVPPPPDMNEEEGGDESWDEPVVPPPYADFDADGDGGGGGATAASDAAAPPLIALPDPDDFLTEAEQRIQRAYRPTWYNAEFGWSGTTYADARAFCESIPRGEGGGGGNLRLCPASAYCPNGPVGARPLFLQMDPFEGIQWAPLSDRENDWVMVGKFNEQSPMTCVTYQEIQHKEPDWGLDGTSPDLKEHILCCRDNPDGDVGAIEADEEAPNDANEGDNLTDMVIGTQKPADSAAGQEPGEGDVSSSVAGPNSSSMTASEMQMQDVHHPTWFGSELGWRGTTHADARAFCESIPHGEGTLHLCPIEAYCPNGPRLIEPLYLQMDPFDGVQWAPFASPSVGDAWLMVGNIDDGQLVCKTYEEINHRDPAWGSDGISTQLKEHMLCCEDKSPLALLAPHPDDAVDDGGGDLADAGVQVLEAVGIPLASNTNAFNDSGGEEESAAITSPQEVGVHASLTESVTNTFDPIWFDVDHGGWDGGSHDDAIQFCEQFAGSRGKKMELCPYAAYCPAGPTQPVIGGHRMNDLDAEGEQWAPMFGKSNHWVMIGKRGHNSATTCLSHVQLEGREPSWGLDDSKNEMKKHVMCCSPLQ